MTDRDEPVDANLFSPARSQAEWEAQGWAVESAEATTSPRLETMISVRFDPDNALLIANAARASGVTRSEFVRRSAVQSAHDLLARQRPALVVRRAEIATQSIGGDRGSVACGMDSVPNHSAGSVVISTWDITVEGMH